MSKERLWNFHVSCRRLRLILLVIAATIAGYAVCSVLFSSANSVTRIPVPITRLQPRPHTRWRLYGGVSGGVSALGIKLSQKSANEVKRTAVLLSTADANKSTRNVQDLVQGLHSLQLTCRDHGDRSGRSGDTYAKLLQVLAIYTKFHAKEKEMTGGRRLIWVCDAWRPCGGLGDRVKGITYALILAMISRRVLILDWREQEFGEQEYLLPNIIDWRLKEEERKWLHGEDTLEMEGDFGAANFENVADRLPRPATAFVHIFSTLEGIGVDIPYEELQANLELIEGATQWIILESNMEPSTLTSDLKTASQVWIKQGMEALNLNRLSPYVIDQVVGVVFRYLFRFSDDLIGEVKDARHVLGLESGPYTGVHLRTGFMGSLQNESVEHPKLYKFQSQWDITLSCAFSHATKQYGGSSLLFLATDSILVKKSVVHSERYRSRFRTLNNSVVHLDRLEKMPHEASEFEKEGVLSVWVELILLAEADSLVIGESGFAFLAESLCFNTMTIDGLTCRPQERNRRPF